MKFLAFVDTHNSKKAFDSLKKKVKKEKPDFLVSAGDFTIFENDVEKVLKKLSRLDGKLFFIHGNHEEEIVVKKIARQYDNIEFIHGRIVEYKGVVLIGWGGGGFTERDVEFEVWVKSKRKKLKNYKKDKKKMIFVGHAPFYKTDLDFLGDSHHGNKSFTKFLKEYNVKVGICGHFHENSGKEDKIKNIRVYNPGPKGKLIEI